MKFLLTLQIILLSGCILTTFGQKQGNTQMTSRQFWLEKMDKVSRPIIYNLANDELKAKMPVTLSPTTDNATQRSKVAYLEAFGRTLSGIAPWLQLEGGSDKEVLLRNQYRDWTMKAIKNAVDPNARDYMVWKGGQPLVDASFFAMGLIRCPWLWEHLDTITQKQVLESLKLTRQTTPPYNNWLLFTASIETFFAKYGYPYDMVRIDYGLREFMDHWYVGDGLYSDGQNFHLDYYNSYVIQPYLNTILMEMNAVTNNRYNSFLTKSDRISRRYAEIQERMINTDGSFPVIGRSVVYRGAAFHHLAFMAQQKKLPSTLAPAQVRCAITAVIAKTLESGSTFTSDGWLNLGVYGKQPEIADSYITTGSLYLCTEIFLPLGLPETDDFWTSPDQPWTSVKIWNGESVPADHAMDLPK